MNIPAKRTLLIMGVMLLMIGSAYGINNLFRMQIFSNCENQVISSVESQDKSKKIVVFSTNCGATTEWGIHASVLYAGDSIDDTSVGNALRINSNRGIALPTDNEGRPIISATWDTPASVTLQYSKNAEIFYQKSEVNGVRITLKSFAN